MKKICSLFNIIDLKPIAFAAVLFIAAISFPLHSSGQMPSGARPPKRLRDAPEILSFTIAPTRIQAGQTATLQWSTSNTERVFIGEPDPEWRTSGELIRAARAVELSGSLVVSPSDTATYRIKVQKGGRSVYKDVTVLVMIAPTPPATCSITGRISGPLRLPMTDDRGQPGWATLREIYLTSEENDERIYTRLQGRTYSFRNVPAGKTYKISPDNFRAEPMERIVTCEPNKSPPEQNFHITGPPPSG